MGDYKKPIPVPSLESKPYWDGLREKRLLIPKCEECGGVWFPPSRLCPHCSSLKTGWVQASGRGKIFSFVIFHRVYHPGFSGEVPYGVALVELEEGPRVLSNIVGVGPEELACEMRVRLVFEEITEGLTLPKFAVEHSQLQEE
jgi:uncharacterized OB-fold protein